MLHIVELVPKCAAVCLTAGARSTPIGAADATNLAEALTFSDLSSLGRGDARGTLKTLKTLLLLQGAAHQTRGSHDGRLLCEGRSRVREPASPPRLICFFLMF